MIQSVLHDRCNQCGRNDPAQVGRVRNGTEIIDKLLCLGCGARWKNYHLDTVELDSPKGSR